jgi:polar amino acid transport system substrate-binding protein
MQTLRTVTAGLFTVAAVVLTACGADDSTSAEGAPPSDADAMPLNQDLHDALPQDIKDAGVLVSVSPGTFPPYTILDTHNQVTGASVDVADALGQILGVKIEHEMVDGLPSLLTGMQAGHFDLAIGPIGDYPDRHAQATFVDWVREVMAFAVPSGNPEGINELDSVCGKRVAVQAGTAAEGIMQDQSVKCKSAGESAIEVQAYKDQATASLTVQSGRSDAFFAGHAPVAHFVAQHELEIVVPETQPKDFENIIQAAVVPVGSPLKEPLFGAFKILFETGRYAEIMQGYGLEENMIEEPGVNLET